MEKTSPSPSVLGWGATGVARLATLVGLFSLLVPFVRLSYRSLNEAFVGRLPDPLAIPGRWIPVDVLDWRSGYSALDVVRWLPALQELAPSMGLKEWTFAVGPLWWTISTLLLLLFVLLRRPMPPFLGDLVALVPLLYGALLFLLCWIWYGGPFLFFSLTSWGFWLGLVAFLVGSASLART
nr:MAG: hypothetical protein KatS3mg041_2068 [Bacteroidota bacterium]